MFLENIHSKFWDRIQAKLDFEDWSDYPQFSTPNGVGRVAWIASLVGIIGTIHVMSCIFLLLIPCCCGSGNPCYNSETTMNWYPCGARFFFYGSYDSNNNNMEEEDFVCRFHWRLIQWCVYISVVCIFHGMEFFVTAIWNPTVANADSFLVNHSKTYTMAFFTSWLEFWTRWMVYEWYHRGIQKFSTTSHAGGGGPEITSSTLVVVVANNLVGKFWSDCVPLLGLVLVIVSQMIRSWAMITAGVSFNHIIQIRKKDNHALVTHGIYRFFRHPAYVGFFYWSIGTQLVLGNFLHFILFTIASWSFFQRRIPYEEESLCLLFPQEYPQYVARTWMGIPFIRSNIMIMSPPPPPPQPTNEQQSSKDD